MNADDICLLSTTASEMQHWIDVCYDCGIELKAWQCCKRQYAQYFCRHE